MVNNASKSEHKKLVRDTVIRISNEVITQGDIILKSYILILKCLLLNYTIPDKEILAAELCEKLHSEEYWLRAHAADALGHLNDLSIPDKLLSALSNELNRTEEENNTKLKVVNYTVEAICEFFYFPTLLEDMFQKDSANRREVLQETAVKMSQLINVDKLKQLESREMAMSAYAAIAEGVLYLRRGAFKERPSFSGKHIKDTIKQLDENAKLIENALDGAAKWGGENKLQAIVRDFRNVIEQVKNEVVSSSGTDEIDAQIVTQDASGQGTQDAAGTVVPTTICTQINILSKEEAHVSMNNYHFGEVKGLQIISDNGQGTQFNSIQGGCDAADTIRAIRELLQSNCTPQQREAAEPVIQELFTSAEQGSLAARDRESWLKKLASALAIGASASTIMQAPWWGTLAQTVQQFFTGL